CDWIYFYCDYYARYYEKLFECSKKFGINVPVVANIPQFYDFDVRGRGVYSPMTTLMFRDFKKYVPEVIFGGAYQMRRLDYENFHDVYITTELMRMISTPGVPVICCELQFGMLRDRPKIYPSDVGLNLATSTASGLNGLNGYMFSGGKNPDDLGGMGTYHEWQAPVTSDGKQRPHFVPIENFGMFVKKFGQKLALTKKHTDITIGFYAPYYATELLEGEFIDELEERRTIMFFDGIARLLKLSGFSYNAIDLERISADELKKVSSLWVFSLEFMDKETQKKLFEYVNSGGILILCPKLPVKNLIFKDEHSLAKLLNVNVQDEVKEKVAYFGKDEVLVYDKIQIFSAVDDKEVVCRTKDGKVCGFLKNCGRGKIAVIGFGISHTFDYHISFVKKIAEKLGLVPSIVVEPFAEVSAVLRKNDEFGFLFLSNYQELDKEVSVRITLPNNKKSIRIPEKGKLKLRQRSYLIIPLTLSTGNYLE
ncbi:MAG: hypothetical protein QME68_04315, partial [Elusimicrobiota bacterium]|nr:hypothetical protein [Elusimicrobiota bacterium]